MESCVHAFRNHALLLLATCTNASITGTSVNTPTVVTKTAGLAVPKRAMATATASSKKLEAPIIPAGAAISKGSRNARQAKNAMATMNRVWMVRGTAIRMM